MTDRSTKLKPCPFCKSNKIEKSDIKKNPGTYFIMCLNCLCTGPMKLNMKSAIKKWNIREKTICDHIFGAESIYGPGFCGGPVRAKCIKCGLIPNNNC